MKPDNFDEWLNYFVIDHDISPNNVIYEGIVDGKMLHVTYRELFDKVREFGGMRKRLREDFSAAAYTGESIDEAASKIVREELLENGLL
ncbi:MAG: hypothetical protein K6G42_11345, partial [Lachnospiraceae bacterium]|nr:hypothetical protein [Lachnospiraceae bacterium]